jgi:hypothetical protein
MFNYRIAVFKEDSTLFGNERNYSSVFCILAPRRKEKGDILRLKVQKMRSLQTQPYTEYKNSVPSQQHVNEIQANSTKTADCSITHVFRKTRSVFHNLVIIESLLCCNCQYIL